MKTPAKKIQKKVNKKVVKIVDALRKPVKKPILKRGRKMPVSAKLGMKRFLQ